MKYLNRMPDQEGCCPWEAWPQSSAFQVVWLALESRYPCFVVCLRLARDLYHSECGSYAPRCACSSFLSVSQFDWKHYTSTHSLSRRIPSMDYHQSISSSPGDICHTLSVTSSACSHLGRRMESFCVKALELVQRRWPSPPNLSQ